MARKKELDGTPERLSLSLTEDQKNDLQGIANRDAGGNISKLSRRMLFEFIKVHKAGNTSYTMDDFGKHKDMIAIPALMSNRDEISKYVNEEYDKTELEKVKAQCKFLLDLINTKLLTQVNNDPENHRIEQRRKSRRILQSDIRFKNYDNLSETEKQMWRQQRVQYTDEEWEKLQERFKKDWNELQ